MEKSKKIFLMILLSIFILIIILAVYFGSKVKPKEDPVEPPSTSITDTRVFERVNSYKEFFNIQANINDVSSVIMDTSYTAKVIYVRNTSDKYYYFINSNKSGEEFYEGDMYFLLVLNKNDNTYVLKEINENITDFYEYAKNYDVKTFNLYGNNKFIENKFSINNLLTTYVQYFKDMLVYDTNLAYNMLDESTKNKYIDYNDFASKAFEIYDSLSSVIFSHNITEEYEKSDDRIYKFEDNNRNKITIHEKNIMDFKISY